MSAATAASLALLLEPAHYAGAAESPIGHWDKSGKGKKGGTATWVDAVGRLVEIPRAISCASPATPMAEPYLRVLAPNKMATTIYQYKKSHSKYLPGSNNLPVTGNIKKDQGAKLVGGISPDVVVAIDSLERAGGVSGLDSLQKRISCPVVFIDSTKATPSDIFLALGALVGARERATKVARHINGLYIDIDACKRNTAIREKKTVYFAEGEDGLTTHANGSAHETIASRIGASLVKNLDAASKGKSVQVEEISKWNPDCIIFTAPQCYDSVFSNKGDNAELWNAVPAIDKDNFACAPHALYGWMSAPLLFSQTIGALWLAKLLYPETFTYDLAKKTSEFYRVMLGYEMDEAEASKLLSNSVCSTK